MAGLASLVLIKIPPDDIYLPGYVRLAAVAGIERPRAESPTGDVGAATFV